MPKPVGQQAATAATDAARRNAGSGEGEESGEVIEFALSLSRRL